MVAGAERGEELPEILFWGKISTLKKKEAVMNGYFAHAWSPQVL